MSTILTARDALLATIRAASTSLTAQNCVTDDWAVLDSAGTYACVIEIEKPTLEGDNLENRGYEGAYQEIHTFKATLAIKVGTGQTSYGTLITNLITLVETVKDEIRGHNRLGDTTVVARCQTIQTSTILERIPRTQGTGASPTHFLQAITCKVWCSADAPEYDGGGY